MHKLSFLVWFRTLLYIYKFWLHTPFTPLICHHNPLCPPNQNPATWLVGWRDLPCSDWLNIVLLYSDWSNNAALACDWRGLFPVWLVLVVDSDRHSQGREGGRGISRNQIFFGVRNMSWGQCGCFLPPPPKKKNYINVLIMEV